MSDSHLPKLLILPSFIRTRFQVHQTLSEILQIEKFLSEAQNRSAGSKMALPKTTSDLDRFAEANKRNVINHGHRIELARFLREIYKRAPVVGVVLPKNISDKIPESIVAWFRSNVHAQTLIQISTSVTLQGGAIIRIKHKTYDASLINRFNSFDETLKQALTFNKLDLLENSYPTDTPQTQSRTKFF